MKISSRLTGNVLILLALCGTGCSTSESTTRAAASNSGQYYIVSAREAEFFRYGPQQANGPDEKLAEGTLVTLIRPAFGYSKVQLSNGLQGYVASQDIHAAPADVVQAATNPPIETGSGSGGRSESSHQPRFRYDLQDPRFLPPPEPLPIDIPEPSPDAEPSPTP